MSQLSLRAVAIVCALVLFVFAATATWRMQLSIEAIIVSQRHTNKLLQQHIQLENILIAKGGDASGALKPSPDSRRLPASSAAPSSGSEASAAAGPRNPFAGLRVGTVTLAPASRVQSLFPGRPSDDPAKVFAGRVQRVGADGGAEKKPSAAAAADESPSKGLPRLGIATINAQPGQGGRGIFSRATWQHRMSFHNKYSYCKKWGFDFIVEDNSIVDKTRDVAWSKIPLYKKWLPKYQWLMWMDMDAYFMNFKIDASKLLDDNYDVIIAKDWHGINMGVFFFKNSPYTSELLNKLWNTPRSHWYPWEEQSALMHYLDPRKGGMAHQAHFKHPPQREFNSYAESMAYGNAASMFKENDLIAHFPNCKAFPNCQRLMKKFYEKSLADNGVKPIDKDATVPTAYYPGDKAPDFASEAEGKQEGQLLQ